MKDVMLIVPQNDMYSNLKPGYLGISYLVSSLSSSGLSSEVFDMNYDNIGFMEKKLIRIKPKFVGITLWLTNVRNAYQLIKFLVKWREEYDLTFRIVCGGPHATELPEEPILHGSDAVIIGEGEIVFTQLVQTDNPAGLDGVFYGNSYGEFQGTRRLAVCKDLSSLSLPDRTYYSKYGGITSFSDISTSRGCVGKCTFCASDISRKIRFNDIDIVLNEIEELYTKDNMNNFFIFDDSFCSHKKRFIEFCEKKINNPNLRRVQWRCYARLNEINDEILLMAKKAGCFSLIVGLEFLDPVTQSKTRKYNREYGVDEIVSILKKVPDNGISLQSNFLFGFPWETIETYKQIADFVRDYGYLFTFIGGYVISPAPGTEVYKEFHEVYGFTNWWLRPEIEDAFSQDPFFCSLGNYADALRHNFFDYSRTHKEQILSVMKLIDSHNVQLTGVKKRILVQAAALSRRLYYMKSPLEEKIFSNRYCKSIICWLSK